MQVTYQNSFWDILWFNFYSFPRARSGQIVLGFFLLTSIYSAFGTTTSGKYPVLVNIFFFLTIFFMQLLAGVILLIIVLAVLYFGRDHRRWQTGVQVAASDKGLEFESALARSEVKWGGVAKIRQSRNLIFIYITGEQACIVPKRAFQNRKAAEDFFSYIRELWEKNKNQLEVMNTA